MKIKKSNLALIEIEDAIAEIGISNDLWNSLLKNVITDLENDKSMDFAIENISNTIINIGVNLNRKPLINLIKNRIEEKQVRLHVFWGNDDAESTLYIPLSDWHRVKIGGHLEYKTKGAYEGKVFKVLWEFEQKTITIHDLKEGCVRISEEPLEYLYFEIEPLGDYSKLFVNN